MRLSRTLFAITGLPAILMTAVLGLLFLQLDAVERHRRQEAAARQALDDMLTTVHTMGRYAFMMMNYANDLDPRWLGQADKFAKEIPQSLDQLDAACRSPESRATAKKIALHLGDMFGCSQEIIWSAAIAPTDLCPIRLNELRSGLQPRLRLLTELNSELTKQLEKEIAAGKQRVNNYEQQRLFVLSGLAVALLSTVAMVAFFNRQIRSRLAVVSENTKRLAAGTALMPPLRGNDEVADLDKTFHSMAKSLGEARKREGDAIANSADVICVLDGQRRIAQINDAIEHWGFSPDELLGKEFSSIVDERSGDELRIGKHWALLSEEKSSLDERTFCVIHDITERKYLEQLIAESAASEDLIFESIPAAVLVLQSDGSIVRANSAARLFLQKLGNPDFLFPEQLKSAGLPIDVSVEQLPSGLFLAVVLDLTERKQLEDTKTELLSMIANDIDAPLGRIAETLKNVSEETSTLNEAGQQKVVAAESESKRLMRLFRDLLRVEQEGSISVSKSATELDATICGAVEAAQPHAERAGVVIEYASSGPASVPIDRQRIVQVILNLLTNAIKFSHGGDKITIRASRSESDNAILIEISDQGPGIPEEIIPTIFDAFVQVRKSDATEKGGSGLGLAICKTIVEAHGGSISVANNAERGCTFTILLPA